MSASLPKESRHERLGSIEVLWLFSGQRAPVLPVKFRHRCRRELVAFVASRLGQYDVVSNDVGVGNGMGIF